MKEKISFRNASVSKKNAFIFSLILIATASCYALVFYSSNQQKNNAVLVDVAGKNRMLSQRIAVMAQLVTCSEEDSISSKARQELYKAVNSHELALKVLLDGGKIPDVNSGKPLPAATDPSLRNKIQETQEYFSEHKRLVGIILKEQKYLSTKTDTNTLKSINPTFNEAAKTLQARFVTGALLKHHVEITSMFVEQARKSQSGFIIILVILMFMNLLVILSGFMLLQKYVSSPLRYLSGISDKISRGNITVEANYKSEDDIGKIADSINELTGNLRKATEFTIKIGNGDFSAHLDIQQSSDTSDDQSLVTSLMNMKQRLLEVAEEDKKRNWATEGLAEFAGIFRMNYELKAFGDMVIKNLIKQLSANQGGLYVLNDNDNTHPYLELISCYAYNRKKFLSQVIEIGEGLVGQAYLEQEYIYLTEIPSDYIRITSGLGEANPCCILIVPLINNNSVEGVLEIASFHKFANHEIAFVKKLAENIASALANTKTNEQTKKLLKESQIQAEQLRAQEEEMRQNMEELSTTQEQMSMKENEYINIIKNLEQELTAYRNQSAA